MQTKRFEVYSPREFQIKGAKKVYSYTMGAFYHIELNEFNEQNNSEIVELLTPNLGHEFYASSFAEDHIVQVAPKEGVKDNASEALMRALKLANIDACISTGKIYRPTQNLDEQSMREFYDLCSAEYANTLIQNIHIIDHSRFDNPKIIRFNRSSTLCAEKNVKYFDLTQKSIDELVLWGRENYLGLNAKEWQVIVEYYQQSNRKCASDIELEILAQSWSEHCKHKIFSANIEFTNERGDTQNIAGLFKTYIRAVTMKLIEENHIDWAISVFSDNAGIVRFDSQIDHCFKVETHNSPSALDPYGGAITGILGVNRDILGCGLGARPIANTDVFCFPPMDLEERFSDSLPKNVISPRKLVKGVHQGVVDGGNKSGIPTVNGAMLFDESYAARPLVYVGSLGVMPQFINGNQSAEKCAQAGDLVVMAGGRVGIDGLHGATFSSQAMGEDFPSTAVQIGDPFTQKLLTEFLIAARDKNLYHSVTDNGAGGLSSSIGEMAQEAGGAKVYLDRVGVKYPNLAPWEIFLSESQERMSFAVPAKHWDEFKSLAELYAVEVWNIGEFTKEEKLICLYKENEVACLDMHFLHEGLPAMQLKAQWDGPRKQENPFSERTLRAALSLQDELLCLLSSPNIANKHYFIKQYDHEVQGATHTKPLVQEEKSLGVNSAGVLWNYPHGGDKDKAVALAVGMHPYSSEINPTYMAQRSADECVRNLLCHGADLKKIALLDNFCWPDPIASQSNPQGSYHLGQLVMACQGLYDFCLEFKSPLISGKDSMKNNFVGKSRKGDDLSFGVRPTLLVSGMAQVDLNLNKTYHSYFTRPDHLVALLRFDKGSLCASEYSRSFTINQDDELILPKLDDLHAFYHKVVGLRDKNLFSAIQDVSDGGCLTTLAEMCFPKQMGMSFTEQLAQILSSSREMMYAEGFGQFIISYPQEMSSLIEAEFSTEQLLPLGTLISDHCWQIADHSQSLEIFYKAWMTTFHKELA